MREIFWPAERRSYQETLLRGIIYWFIPPTFLSTHSFVHPNPYAIHLTTSENVKALYNDQHITSKSQFLQLLCAHVSQPGTKLNDNNSELLQTLKGWPDVTSGNTRLQLQTRIQSLNKWSFPPTRLYDVMVHAHTAV
jgi:hypothetical protein